MNETVGVVVASGGAAWELPLLHGLQRRELGVEVVRRCVDHGELLGIALRDRPRAVIVDARLPWIDRDFVATLRGVGVAVLTLGEIVPGREAFGVACLPATATAEAIAAVVHAAGLAPAGDGAMPAVRSPARIGRLVTCWGAPGAPGRTTVAMHLAIESARTGMRVLLVDADVWAASVAQRLDVAETPSLAQAAEAAGGGWVVSLGSCVHEMPGGLVVLPGLPRAELWPEVREQAWRAVLAAALERFELVVVDVAAPIEEDEDLVVDRIPYRRNLVTNVALEQADRIIFVMAADPVGLRRGVMAHRTATGRLGAASLSFVLNRVPGSARRAQDCSRAVSEWTGATPTALLPDEPAFERAVWEGRPLHAVAPRSRWLRELRDCSSEIVG